VTVMFSESYANLTFTKTDNMYGKVDFCCSYYISYAIAIAIAITTWLSVAIHINVNYIICQLWVNDHKNRRVNAFNSQCKN